MGYMLPAANCLPILGNRRGGAEKDVLNQNPAGHHQKEGERKTLLNKKSWWFQPFWDGSTTGDTGGAPIKRLS